MKESNISQTEELFLVHICKNTNLCLGNKLIIEITNMKKISLLTSFFFTFQSTWYPLRDAK